MVMWVVWILIIIAVVFFVRDITLQGIEGNLGSANVKYHTLMHRALMSPDGVTSIKHGRVYPYIVDSSKFNDGSLQQIYGSGDFVAQFILGDTEIYFPTKEEFDELKGFEKFKQYGIITKTIPVLVDTKNVKEDLFITFIYHES